MTWGQCWMLSRSRDGGACVICVRRKLESIQPARCSAFNLGGHTYGSGESSVCGPEERGKKSVSRFSRARRVWKSSLGGMEADISDRSRCRSCVHLLSAAKLLMANEACGATNASMLCFNRPNSLAVRLRLELCTSSPMSSLRTRTANEDCRMCAFFEGQTVVTNSEKFPP